MTLINVPIPNLINGVSQQSDALRLPSQGTAQTNAYSSVVEGLIKRPPTKYIAKIINGTLAAATMHLINRDATERYWVVLTDNNLKVFDLNGVEKTVAFPNGTGYLDVSDAATAFRAKTIADYTFIVNREKTVAMDGSDLSTNPGFQGLVYVKQGNYTTDYKVIINSQTVASKTTHDTTASDIKTNQIATDLKNSLTNNLNGNWAAATAYVVGDYRNNGGNWYKCTQAGTSAGSGGPTGTGTNIVDNTCRWDYVSASIAWTLALEGSTIHIKRNDGADFTLKTEDSNGDRNIVTIKDKIQRFTDLPNVAPSGFVVKVSGDSSSTADDYYVIFETNNTGATFDRGVWKETIKPGINRAFDASTMPHILVREADGTFTFKRATWDKREVGDTDSAPQPSFIGQKLNDVVFYRNRLGVLADDGIVFTRAGDFFNFWPTTVTTVLDSDPIDVSVPHEKVSILNHGLPFSEKLLLFSDQTQFVLDPGRSLLTPKTISIDATTEFEAVKGCKPIGAGRNIYFAVPKGAYVGVREYYVGDETQTYDAADITSHVPSYIPEGAFRLAGATNEDIICLLTTGEQASIFVYKYYWSGDDKLQSSWSKWTFGSGVKVLDIAFINTDLYLVVQREDGVYLEKLSVEPNQKDANHEFVFHLDRRITNSQCTSVTYNSGTNLTTWTLPYAESGTMQVVTRSTGGSEVPGTVLTINRPTSTTITATGDYSTTPVFLGKKYEFRYQFSTPVLKENDERGSGVAVGGGRFQVSRYILTFNNTGYFQVEVTPDYRDASTYRFTGRLLGSGNNVLGQVSLESGQFQFPVMSKNDQVKIEIVNDTFLPCAFTSGEVEGRFIMRTQRS